MLAGAACVIGVAAGVFVAGAQAKTGTITEFTNGITGGGSPYPNSITKGAEGNMWYTDYGANRIGRITPAGVVTEFSAPSSAPLGITTGPEGDLWFVDNNHPGIGRITPTGTVTQFPLPTTGFSIATGPDGNLWITSFSDSIYRMTPSGTLTTFALPSGANAVGITSGPEGDLWFTDVGTDSIGRITTTGEVKEFPLGSAGEWPYEITTGPEGNLWFTDEHTNSIGRMTTTGKVTEFPVLTPGARVQSITSSGGALWFTEEQANKIGRITPSGQVSEFPLSSRAAGEPEGIATGSDGNPWFVESGGSVAQITQAGSITEYPTWPGLSTPDGITTGAEGNLWFTEIGAGRIGKISPTTGAVSEIPLANPNSRPFNITTGPEGDLWFTEEASGEIGRVNPITGVVTEFALPPGSGEPLWITSGPEGDLWFTQRGEPNYIGTINPATTKIEEFPVPDSGPVAGIALGSDGMLWFAQARSDKIGRIDPATGAISEFTVPGIPPGEGSLEITPGPDGNLWFTVDSDPGYIGRITTTGVSTLFPVLVEPDSIVTGAGGNLWFTSLSFGGGIGGEAIGKLTLSGQETEFTEGVLPEGAEGEITLGPEGDLWFTGYYSDSIGRFEDDPAPLDLGIDMTAQSSTVVSGDMITYNLNITNYGAATAPHVSVIDNLPAGVAYSTTIPASDNCTFEASGSGGGTVGCDLGGLAAETSTVVTVVVRASQPGTLTNTASVFSNGHQDQEPSLDTSSVTTTVCPEQGCPKRELAGTGASGNSSASGSPVTSGGSATAGGAGTSRVLGQTNTAEPACVVPHLRRLTVHQARRALARSHCRLGKIHGPRRVSSPRVLRVRGQSARAGTRHAGGYAISIVVG